MVADNVPLDPGPTAGRLIENYWSGDVHPLLMALAWGLLLVAALSASLGAALLVYSPTKLQKLLGGDAGTRLLAELQRHDQELRILARLLTIASATGCILLANASLTGLLGQVLLVAFCVVMALATAVLPPAIAQRQPERVVVTTLPAMRPLRALLHYPLLLPLIYISRPLFRALRMPEPPTAPEAIADEILAKVADTRGGELAEEERAWIGNIVELKELHASEVMTPRTDIHALDGATSLEDAVREAVQRGHSRLPVYRESIDEVIGVFYAKDVLSRLAENGDVSSGKVGDLCRPALFAPESMRVSELLKEFQSSKVQMAIVIDEYGGTAGLITIEDILEEIVGEIEDEFDPEAEAPIQVIEAAQVVEVSAKTRVEEANDALGVDVIPESEDYDTVGGFVFSHLGQIPAVGTVFQVDGLELNVLAADHRRVSRVRLTRLATQATDT